MMKKEVFNIVQLSSFNLSLNLLACGEKRIIVVGFQCSFMSNDSSIRSLGFSFISILFFDNRLRQAIDVTCD